LHDDGIKINDKTFKIFTILSIRSILLSYNWFNSLNFSFSLNFYLRISISSIFSLLFLFLFDLFFFVFLFRLLFFLCSFLGLFLFLIRKEVSTHKWLKNFRYSQTLFSLIVFENTAKSTLSCAECTIKHMNISLLSILYKNTCTSFFLDPQRIPRFLDWKSVQFEQDTSSL